jgi:hypothetical protein
MILTYATHRNSLDIYTYFKKTEQMRGSGDKVFCTIHCLQLIEIDNFALKVQLSFGLSK